MKILPCLFTLTFTFLIFPVKVSAQVVINEVLSNPKGIAVEGDPGKTTENGAEWVELYNLSATPASLEGCTLFLDDSSTTQKVIFSSEHFVEKYKVISWDNAWLNNNGDTIKLECPGFTDLVNYGAEGAQVGKPREDQTFGRSPDGTGNFQILSVITIGGENSQPPTLTPTSTPVPTNTQKPTPSVKSTTATPGVTHFPVTGIKSVIPTVDNKVEITPEITTENTIVSSVSGESKLAYSGTHTPEISADREKGMVLADTTAKVSPIAIVITFSGVLLLAISIYIVIRDYKKSYNSVSDE